MIINIKRYCITCCLFLLFIFGSVSTLYAQGPLFPPLSSSGANNNTELLASDGGSNITGLSNSTFQEASGANNNTELLASAEMQLYHAIRDLERGDTDGANSNLSISRQQFASVVGSSPEPSSGETKVDESMAIGGLYLVDAVKALENGDTNSMDRNLNLSLRQFSPILGIQSWELILQPSEDESEEIEETTGSEPVRWSDAQLLAGAGTHLSEAIRNLERGNTNSLNEQLAIAQQQAQFQILENLY